MTERHVDKLRRSRDHIQRMLNDPESRMSASVRAELEIGLAAIERAIDREADPGANE